MSIFRKPKPPEKFTSYYNLLDAFTQKGCPVCQWVKKTVQHYLDGLLYEQVNDPEVREELQGSWGFCAKHAARVVEFGDGLGLGIIYRDLLASLAEKLKNWKEKHLTAEKLCPACRVQHDIEKRAAELFQSHFHDEEFQSALSASAPLCLPHLVGVLAHLSDESHQERLLEIQQTKAEKLRHELSEFIRKHDYRFQAEGFAPEEADSWKRAVMLFVGQLP